MVLKIWEYVDASKGKGLIAELEMEGFVNRGGEFGGHITYFD